MIMPLSNIAYLNAAYNAFYVLRYIAKALAHFAACLWHSGGAQVAIDRRDLRAACNVKLQIFYFAAAQTQLCER